MNEFPNDVTLEGRSRRYRTFVLYSGYAKKSVSEYFDWIDAELKASNLVCESQDPAFEDYLENKYGIAPESDIDPYFDTLDDEIEKYEKKGEKVPAYLIAHRDNPEIVSIFFKAFRILKEGFRQ